VTGCRSNETSESGREAGTEGEEVVVDEASDEAAQLSEVRDALEAR
jgi:hypothetical protein